jgi:hypothetical protein
MGAVGRERGTPSPTTGLLIEPLRVKLPTYADGHAVYRHRATRRDDMPVAGQILRIREDVQGEEFDLTSSDPGNWLPADTLDQARKILHLAA